MILKVTKPHYSDSAYDPVIDGVSQGLEQLFPPIYNPPHKEDAADEVSIITSDHDEDDIARP